MHKLYLTTYRHQQITILHLVFMQNQRPQPPPCMVLQISTQIIRGQRSLKWAAPKRVPSIDFWRGPDLRSAGLATPHRMRDAVLVDAPDAPGRNRRAQRRLNLTIPVLLPLLLRLLRPPSSRTCMRV